MSQRWKMLLIVLTLAYAEARHLGQVTSSPGQPNHLLKRQLLPSIHDERKDISSDIQRELYYSGHDSKDFIASLSSNPQSQYNGLVKTKDPYNDLKQYLKMEFLKDGHLTPHKNHQSEIEKAYFASTNEKLQMSSEDDKIEAKSRFPEHHPEDDLRIRYHNHYGDNNDKKDYSSYFREQSREMNGRHFLSDLENRRDDNERRRHTTNDNENDYDEENDRHLEQDNRPFHDNDLQSQSNDYEGQGNYRRHGHQYFRGKENEEAENMHHQHTGKHFHHKARHLQEDRIDDYPHHIKSEHSISKAFEYQDDLKNSLTKSEHKSLKHFLRERDRDVYKHLFHERNAPNVLFDNVNSDNDEHNKPILPQTDSMIRDNTNLRESTDNFHALGLTPYKHFTGMSDIAETLPDDSTTTSIAATHDVQLPPSIQTLHNEQRPNIATFHATTENEPTEHILHDPQSSNDLVAMSPADDAISPGVQAVHAFHAPVMGNIPSEIDGLTFHHNNIGLPKESSEFYIPPIHHMGSMPTTESDFIVPPNGQTPSLEHPSEMAQPPAGISIGLVDPVKVANRGIKLPSFTPNMLAAQKSDVNHRNDVEREDEAEDNIHPTEKRDLNIENEVRNSNQRVNQFQNNPLVSVDTNNEEDKRFILQQLLIHRDQAKKFDTDVRQEISKLNEQEQTIAASAALQDDKIDLDAAQDLADDNKNKLINMRGSIPRKGSIPRRENNKVSRRHYIGGQLRNSHHFIVDQVPVYKHHQKFVHLYPQARIVRKRFSPIFSSYPPQRNILFGHHRHYHPIVSVGRHNHAFDQIFQGGGDDTEFVTEEPNGYRAAEDDDQMTFTSPSFHDGYASPKNRKNLRYVHLGPVNPNMLNREFDTQVANGGIITKLPPHDSVTENIVSDLSQGNDVTTVKGEDQVHVEHQDGENRINGWLSRPYIYEAHPGRGWGDYAKTYHNSPSYKENFPLRNPISKMRPIRRFPLEVSADDDDVEETGATTFTNYNAPVHGLVVSEKDAKKIGLYDSNYLKKLGIWDDASSIWNGGLPWGMYGIPWGNSGLNYAWTQGLIDRNAELREINNTSKNKEKIPDKACMIPTDVAFLFDASNTGTKKREYFELFIEFAKQIVGYHQPSLEGYHYGAVYYSKGAKMMFDFEKSYEMNEVVSELDSLKNLTIEDNNSDLEQALKITKEELFDKTAREWVYQVLVILTDSKGIGEVESWARQLRDSTVNIYVIGLVNSQSMADIGQMEKLGTRPYKNHVFQVNPDHLLGTLKAVSHPQHLARIIPNQICRVNVAFLIDLIKNDTNTIGQIKRFVSETTADLGISQFGSHVSIIGYGLPFNSNDENMTVIETKDKWDLVSKLDRTSLEKGIDNLEEEISRTRNMGEALNLAFKYFTEESPEPVITTFWRYINVTIVIHANSDMQFIEEAQNLRDHGIIIHVLDLSANATNSDNLSKISSTSEEFYLHHIQDLSKLRVVAKRMRQYLSQLLFSQESEAEKVAGGWEASYGNIMFDEEKYNVSHSTQMPNQSLQHDKGHAKNMTVETTVPLIETLSQEPDWSKYIKMPTPESSTITINKDDVELQDKVDENSTLSPKKKETVTRHKIIHKKT